MAAEVLAIIVPKIVTDNVYLQHSDRELAMFCGYGEKIWYIDQKDDIKKYIDMMGDATSKFYIIPTE